LYNARLDPTIIVPSGLEAEMELPSINSMSASFSAFISTRKFSAPLGTGVTCLNANGSTSKPIVVRLTTQGSLSTTRRTFGGSHGVGEREGATVGMSVGDGVGNMEGPVVGEVVG